MLRPLAENLPSAEARVEQRPVAVELECPRCGHSTSSPYGEFCDRHGDPPDWNGTVVTCESCGEKFIIDGQDWD